MVNLNCYLSVIDGKLGSSWLGLGTASQRADYISSVDITNLELQKLSSSQKHPVNSATRLSSNFNVRKRSCHTNHVFYMPVVEHLNEQVALECPILIALVHFYYLDTPNTGSSASVSVSAFFLYNVLRAKNLLTRWNTGQIIEFCYFWSVLDMNEEPCL